MLRRGIRRFGQATLAAFAGAALLLAAPGGLQAQEGTTSGSIVGQVVNPDGTPAPNARVIVTNIQRGTTREVLTNDDGRFVVALLQPGRYRVRAESPPQPAVQLPPMQISIGERRSVTLQLRPVEVQDIGVEIGRGGVDQGEGGVVDLVEEEQIESLPTPGRDFTDFIELSGLVSPQPGNTTGGQFSIGGAKTTGTNIQIDGADANNAFFGENRGSSRVPFTFSLASIREFQVITNGYDVEYGRYSGGIVNAVTKSGTNEFQGSAHLFWRDEALTSNSFLGESPETFEAFQFGGVYSGPIVKDELHFLVSGDFQLWDQPAFALTKERTGLRAATINRLTSALRDVGIDNPGEDIGRFTETKDQANVFGRLDWTINEDHRVAVRANYSDFENQNDNIGQNGFTARTAGSTFNDESISVVGELNSILSRNVFNTFRVQYSYEDRPRPGNSQLPLMSLEDVPVGEGDNTRTLTYGGSVIDFGNTNVMRETKIQVTNNLIWNLGDHTLKVGTDNIFSDTFNKVWLLGNGVTVFDPLFLYEDGIEAMRDEAPFIFFRLVPDGAPAEPPTASFQNQDYSFYAQDAWQATNKLRLTLGLRYDWKVFDRKAGPLADEGDQQLLTDQFGVSMETVPEDRDNVSPRLSFTYDADGDASTVIRGGAGIFYGRFPNVLHGNVLKSTPHPQRFMFCGGSYIPEYDISEMQDDLSAIPSTCGPGSSDAWPFGFGGPGEPQIPVWDEDMQQPTTYKANLGFEQRLSQNWRASIQGIFTRTENNYSVRDMNLQAAQFTNPAGRPVHVAPDAYDPTSGAMRSDRGVVDELDRVMVQDSRGKFRSWNVKAEIQGRVTEDFRLAANYTWNHAFDNSSYVCCSAFAFFEDTPTFGNLNELGGFGDDEEGNWGPSDFERRHVFVANGTWSLPADFQVSFIYRAQSGNPFTPSIDGDVNGDGLTENDRPYLPDPDQQSGVVLGRTDDAGNLIENAEQTQSYRQLLAENQCLQEHVGSIISRNECRNPWFHRVDMRMTKSFRTVGGQRAEVILDLFNVLDGVNNLFGLDWSAGEFVLKEDRLFFAEGVAEDGRVIYSVNEQYGQEFTFNQPFQFQAQLGVKYHF